MASEESEGRPEDRRRYPRLRESCQVRVRPIVGASVEEGTFDTRTLDISGGGLSFTSDSAFEQNACLALEINFVDLDDPLTSLARVAYCRPDGSSFTIGVEFLWVGWGIAGAREAISEHVEKALDTDAE